MENHEIEGSSLEVLVMDPGLGHNQCLILRDELVTLTSYLEDEILRRCSESGWAPVMFCWLLSLSSLLTSLLIIVAQIIFAASTRKR